MIISGYNAGGAAALTIKSSGDHVAGPSATSALPAHSVGDFILVIVGNGTSNNITGTTVPPIPAASGNVPTWTSAHTSNGTSGGAVRFAYTIATSSSHTYGNWGNATAHAVVMSGYNSTTMFGSKIGAAIPYYGNFDGPAPTSSLTPVSTSLNSKFFFVSQGYCSGWGTLSSTQTKIGTDFNGSNVVQRVSYNNVSTSTAWDGHALSGSGWLYGCWAGLEVLSG